MTQTKRQRRDQREREIRENAQRGFVAELNQLVSKYGATIIAESSGGAYCSPSVTLEVEIDGHRFDIGEEAATGITDERIEVRPVIVD